MKKVMYGGVLLAVFMIVIIGQVVQAEEWPPALPGLTVKMSSGDSKCAVFAAPNAGLIISCGNGAVVTDTYDCPAVGKNQVCKSRSQGTTKTVSFSDSSTVKCNKVCGPVSPGFRPIK